MHPERMKPKKKLRGGVHVSDESIQGICPQSVSPRPRP